MWYLIKYLSEVQVDEVHCFDITSVIGVNDKGKEVKQACWAAVLQPCWESPIRFLPSRCAIIFPLINLSIVLQTTDVRLIGQ